MLFRYGPTESDTSSRRVAIAPPTLTRKGTSVYDRIRASLSLVIITIAAATILAPESSQAIDTVVPSLMPGLAAFRYGAPQTKIREQCKCECTDVEGPAVNADFAGDGVTVMSDGGVAVARKISLIGSTASSVRPSVGLCTARTPEMSAAAEIGSKEIFIGSVLCGEVRTHEGSRPALAEKPGVMVFTDSHSALPARRSRRRCCDTGSRGRRVGSCCRRGR